MMESQNGFFGSLDSSIKLKQTVNLNRRTLTGLDNKLSRFRREKEKCTHLISREKQKFLEKQKRILPNIRTDLPVTAASPTLRPKSCQAKLPRSAPITPVLKDAKRENFLFLEKAKHQSTKENILPRTPSDETIECITDKLLNKPRLRKRSFSSPIMKRPVSTNLLIQDIENLDVSETSRSLSDLNNSELNKNTKQKEDTDPYAIWNPVAYEEVKGCRYLRRTREQRNEFETVHGKTCYCNSCTLTKTIASPKPPHRRALKSSFE